MPECYGCGEEVYVPSDREFTEGFDLCYDCTLKRLMRVKLAEPGRRCAMRGIGRGTRRCRRVAAVILESQTDLCAKCYERRRFDSDPTIEQLRKEVPDEDE